jgi:hypothetical protein
MRDVTVDEYNRDGPQTLPFPHAWQNRVVEEKRENDERLGKLQTFLGNPSQTRALSSAEDLQMLLEQEYLMRRLSDLLRLRIARFGRHVTKAPAELVSIRGIVAVTGEAEISNEVDVLQALKVAGAVDVHVAYNPQDFGWLVACMGPADLNPVMPKGVKWQRQ